MSASGYSTLINNDDYIKQNDINEDINVDQKDDVINTNNDNNNSFDNNVNQNDDNKDYQNSINMSVLQAPEGLNFKIDVNNMLLTQLPYKKYENDFDIPVTSLDTFRQLFMRSDIMFMKTYIDIYDFIKYLGYNINVNYNKLLVSKVDDYALEQVYLNLAKYNLSNYNNDYIVNEQVVNSILALLCNIDIADLISKMNLQEPNDIIEFYTSRMKLQGKLEIKNNYEGQLQQELFTFNQQLLTVDRLPAKLAITDSVIRLKIDNNNSDLQNLELYKENKQLNLVGTISKVRTIELILKNSDVREIQGFESTYDGQNLKIILHITSKEVNLYIPYDGNFRDYNVIEH